MAKHNTSQVNTKQQELGDSNNIKNNTRITGGTTRITSPAKNSNTTTTTPRGLKRKQQTTEVKETPKPKKQQQVQANNKIKNMISSIEDKNKPLAGTTPQQQTQRILGTKKQQVAVNNNQKMDKYLIKLKPPVLVPKTTTPVETTNDNGDNNQQQKQQETKEELESEITRKTTPETTTVGNNCKETQPAPPLKLKVVLQEPKLKTTGNVKPQKTKQQEITTNQKETTTSTNFRPVQALKTNKIGNKELKSSKQASVNKKKRVPVTDIRKFLENKKLEKQTKLENLRTPDVEITAPCPSSNTLNIIQSRSYADNTHVEGILLINSNENPKLGAGSGTGDNINHPD